MSKYLLDFSNSNDNFNKDLVTDSIYFDDQRLFNGIEIYPSNENKKEETPISWDAGISVKGENFSSWGWIWP